eukprot:COSAG03_NODE_1900_length_3378_cov_1.639219_2_plen_235_part_00
MTKQVISSAWPLYHNDLASQYEGMSGRGESACRTHTHTHTQTHTHTHTHTHTQTHAHAHAHAHTHTHTHTETHTGVSPHTGHGHAGLGPFARSLGGLAAWRVRSDACRPGATNREEQRERQIDRERERQRETDRETETERQSRAHLVPGGRPRPSPSRRVSPGQQRVLGGGRRLRARVEARDDRAVVRALPELLAQQLQEHLVCNVLGRLEELGAQLGVSDDPLVPTARYAINM